MNKIKDGKWHPSTKKIPGHIKLIAVRNHLDSDIDVLKRWKGNKWREVFWTLDYDEDSLESCFKFWSPLPGFKGLYHG